MTDRHSPVLVSRLSGITNISAGSIHNLATDVNGSISAWGWNGFGQLGDGTTTDRALPIRLANSAPATKVSAGFAHSLALDTIGNISAWGWNAFGQLGDGTTTTRLAPVSLNRQLDPQSGRISAGLLHSAGLSSGEVLTWGWNGFGQLGNGTTTDRHVPTKDGATNFQEISAGAFHTVGTHKD